MGAQSSLWSIVSLKSSWEDAVRGQDSGVGNIPSSGSDFVTSEELVCLLFSRYLASSLEKHHPFQLNFFVTSEEGFKAGTEAKGSRHLSSEPNKLVNLYKVDIDRA